MTVWLDDGFIESSAGAIDAADRGLLLADGVFDTALVLGGRAFREAQHLERLDKALKLIEIDIDIGRIATAMRALATRQVEGSVRLTVTRGPGPRGLGLPAEPRPTLLGTYAPFAPTAVFKPLRLSLSPVRRNETSPLSRLKSLGYLDAILANRKATSEGADEAVFLNTRGHLACTALANIFLVEGFEIVTPPLADGALPGIMRQWVIENADDHGFRCLEQSIEAKRLKAADALFVTNSLRLVAPASLVDAKGAKGRREADVPDGVVALMRGACEAIAAECGVDPRIKGANLPEY